MRASPACQITIRDFGGWRAGVGVLALVAFGSAGSWLLGPSRLPAWAFAVLLMMLLAVVCAACLLLWCSPFSLRWDTQRWNLGPAATMGEEPSAGRLAVALDFGAWMLLRFRPDSATGRFSTVWIPVQKTASHPDWHAFRCAVYSSRPDPRGLSTASLDAAE